MKIIILSVLSLVGCSAPHVIHSHQVQKAKSGGFDVVPPIVKASKSDKRQSIELIFEGKFTNSQIAQVVSSVREEGWESVVCSSLGNGVAYDGGAFKKQATYSDADRGRAQIEERLRKRN